MGRGMASADPRELESFMEEVYRILSKVGERTLDLPGLASGDVGLFTIDVPGAKPGMTVDIGAPALLDNGLLWCGSVSADDVVTIRVYNPTGASIDAVEGTWTVRVKE